MSFTRAFLLFFFLSSPLFAFNLPSSQLIENQFSVVEYDNDYTKYEGDGKLLLKKGQKTSVKSEFSFSYLFYKPLYNSKNRLIVLTPNIGGVTLLEVRMAHKLAKNGYHVLVPKTVLSFEEVDEDTFDDINNIQLYSVSLTGQLIDKLYEREQSFDRDRIGLVGVSLGGIRSTMLMGIDNRYRAMFISVAGSDLASIYAQSQHETVMDIRYRHMSFLGLTDEAEYESKLREYITLDPQVISNSAHLDNIAMIIANDDRVVPSTNQWKLWRQLRDLGFRPKTYEKNCRHIMGALWIVRYENRVVDWMDQRL